MNIEKIFGRMSVYNIKKEQDQKDYKSKFIWHWWMPNWLKNHIEDISFDNVYKGTPMDCQIKRTCLVFSGSKNLYWIFFRHKKKGTDYGNWRPCLKFMKTSNDHTGCG